MNITQPNTADALRIKSYNWMICTLVITINARGTYDIVYDYGTQSLIRGVYLQIEILKGG